MPAPQTKNTTKTTTVVFNLPDARPIKDAMVVKIWRIKPAENQPRSKFDPVVLADISKTATELAAKAGGIEGTGIIQPLLGRWTPGSLDDKGQPKENYGIELIAGETRYWGLKEAGLEDVPIIIRDLSQDDAFEYALIENIVRGDLNPLDEARSIRAIMNKRKLSTRGAAEYIYGDRGKRGIINNALAILKLDDDVQAVIDARADTVYSARQIQRVTEPKERKALIHLAVGGATYDEIAARVKAWQQRQPAKASSSSSSSTDSEGSGNSSSSSNTTYGKGAGKKGVSIVPRINVEDALSVGIRHTGLAHDAMKMLHEHNQTYPASERRKLRAQATEVVRLAGEIIELIDNPPSKKKK